MKKVFLRISQILQEFPVLEYFFSNKIAGLYFTKIETPTQVLSCEFCEIFKNIFYRAPPSDCFWVYLEVWRRMGYLTCNTLWIFSELKSLQMFLSLQINVNEPNLTKETKFPWSDWIVVIDT